MVTNPCVHRVQCVDIVKNEKTAIEVLAIACCHVTNTTRPYWDTCISQVERQFAEDAPEEDVWNESDESDDAADEDYWTTHGSMLLLRLL